MLAQKIDDFAHVPEEEMFVAEEPLPYHDEIGAYIWKKLEPLMPKTKSAEDKSEDNCRFLNGVFWILRTGAAWRELPPEYGKWNSVYRRFKRWREKGIWEKVLEVLINEPEYGWLMVDVRQTRFRATGTGGVEVWGERERATSNTRYIFPWMQMVCRSEYLAQWLPRQIAQKLSY